MNNLQVFENSEFGSIRTVEINGEPWLVGKDVATALGYKNPQEAIRTHVDDEDKGVSEILTPGGKQQLPIINESGLYSLILSSKLPGAKKFKRWVTAEVLPSIRRTGGYMPPDTAQTLADLTAAVQLLTERLDAMSAFLPGGAGPQLPLFETADRTWNNDEFYLMQAYALRFNREDFISICYLGRFAGLRIHECFQIDTDIAVKAVKENVLTITGDDGFVRTIPVEPAIEARLRFHLVHTAPGRKLLVPERKQARTVIKEFQEFFRVYRQKVQGPATAPPLTFHGLRHTYAVEQYQKFIQAGKSPYEARLAVSRLLGHGRDDVTNIYMASLKEDEEDLPAYLEVPHD